MAEEHAMWGGALGLASVFPTLYMETSPATEAVIGTHGKSGFLQRLSKSSATLKLRH